MSGMVTLRSDVGVKVKDERGTDVTVSIVEPHFVTVVVPSDVRMQAVIVAVPVVVVGTETTPLPAIPGVFTTVATVASDVHDKVAWVVRSCVAP